MRKTVILFSTIFLFFIGNSSHAEDTFSKVRASLNAGDELWVGQKVPLIIELLVPGYFSGSPIFDLPNVPGLLILPPTGSPTVSGEAIEGVSYSVQRYEFMLFARTSRPSTIPPFEIRFGFKHHPLDHDPISTSAKTTAISFTAKAPPMSGSVENLITSSDLTVTESWSPTPGKQAKTGDAFVRTIVWKASDVPGMAFPPLDAGHIEGLGIYHTEPVVNDTRTRGQQHGERQDSVTYVCKTGGHFVIPALSLKWWDPQAKQMKQADFPARSFDVPVPPIPPEKFSVKITRTLKSHWPAISCGIAVILMLGLALHHSWAAVVRFHKLLLPRHLAPLNPEP